MSKRQNAKVACGSGGYEVSAVITVDARGQTVLPKEVRKRMGLVPGERLAVILHGDGKEACCMSMIKIGELSEMVNRPMRILLEVGDGK